MMYTNLPFFLILLVNPTTACAYIDPGSGMLMWQGLIAAVGALLVVVRHPIQWIKGVWRRVRGLPPPSKHRVAQEETFDSSDRPHP